jgi:SAM-dependent methyltransferase
MGPKVEFDHYAKKYQELLRDPVRDGFAQNGGFFHQRKWILIANFLQRNALSTDKLAWLDVGCGQGELLRLGSLHFDRAVGCDLSGEMARDAKGIEVHLQQSPDTLPFPDLSIDFITAVCVYHHVDERNRMPLTCDIRRVLRPNGIFCMIEHNPLNPVTRLIVSRSPVDINAHLLSARRAIRYMEQSGLRHLESQYFLCLPETYYYKVGYLEWILRKLPLGGQYAVFGRK